MRHAKHFLTLSFLLLYLFAQAQFIPNRYFTQDIAHYQFALSLNDATDEIQGEATILVRFRAELDTLTLDLSDRMQVTEIKNDKGVPLKFIHQNDLLNILLPQKGITGGSITLKISYRGIPEDGLSIGRFQQPS
jgi:hypothetical protein